MRAAPPLYAHFGKKGGSVRDLFPVVVLEHDPVGRLGAVVHQDQKGEHGRHACQRCLVRF